MLTEDVFNNFESITPEFPKIEMHHINHKSTQFNCISSLLEKKHIGNSILSKQIGVSGLKIRLIKIRENEFCKTCSYNTLQVLHFFHLSKTDIQLN